MNYYIQDGNGFKEISSYDRLQYDLFFEFPDKESLSKKVNLAGHNHRADSALSKKFISKPFCYEVPEGIEILAGEFRFFAFKARQYVLDGGLNDPKKRYYIRFELKTGFAYALMFNTERNTIIPNLEMPGFKLK